MAPTSQQLALGLSIRNRWWFQQWRDSVGTSSEEEKEDYDSDDSFVAPAVRQDSQETIAFSSDDENEEQVAPAKPAPAPKTEEEDSKTKEKEEKAEQRRANKNVIQESKFLPKRATEQDCPNEVIDLWSGRCCCRAWTPANRLCVGNKNRKQTFGGRCKADGKIPLREMCDYLGSQLGSIAADWQDNNYWEPADKKEEEQFTEKALCYEQSAEFWNYFPDHFNEQVKKQDPEGTKDMEDPASEVMVCKSHYNALAEKGRTMGFQKGTDKDGIPVFHPMVTATHPSREQIGIFEEVLTPNEMGFIWEDPEKFVFYGSSSSKDTKHSPPASVDTTKKSTYGSAVKGKPWTINNASDNPLWQEQDAYYW